MRNMTHTTCTRIFLSAADRSNVDKNALSSGQRKQQPILLITIARNAGDIRQPELFILAATSADDEQVSSNWETLLRIPLLQRSCVRYPAARDTDRAPFVAPASYWKKAARSGLPEGLIIFDATRLIVPRACIIHRGPPVIGMCICTYVLLLLLIL